MKPIYSVSRFGHIYQKALLIQLQKMGNSLRSLRKSKQLEIEDVAAAINLRPEVLEKIEAGEHDMRLKTLFALCDYYNIREKDLVGSGELMRFHFD